MTCIIESSQPAAQEPTLRPAAFDDYEAIGRLWATQSWQMPSRTDWRGLWVNNPLEHRLGPDYILGWVLEAAGKVVGTLSTFPRAYKFQAQDLVCANPLGWVVDPAYHGYATLLFYEFFNQAGMDLLMYATVPAKSAPYLTYFPHVFRSVIGNRPQLGLSTALVLP